MVTTKVVFRNSYRQRALYGAMVAAAAMFLGACQSGHVNSASGDRLEPGLQGEALAQDNPGSILATPYSKGIRVIGHNPIQGRDTNVQLAWVDHCAYVGSLGRAFSLVGAFKGDPALEGIAVIDVSDPKQPRMVRTLREKGALAASETMSAVTAPDGRKVLVAGNYWGGRLGPDAQREAAWLAIYDVSDCANPKLMSEMELPENAHTLTLSPDGRRIYGTLEALDEGGIHVIDITDMAKPRYLRKFGATTADGRTVPFMPHEISISPDERRIYAAVNESKVGDLNQDVPFLPPSPVSMGPNGGGVYIFDNSDSVDGRPDPKLRLISSVPHGGWHSVMPAKINGVPHLVAGSELGACPGTWPKIINIADERRPFIAGEFKLAMNRAENCPKLSAEERAKLGYTGAQLGTAALHFNDVDSATNTRMGLFNFAWAGLRVADLKDPAKPAEIAYFKPGDFCTGHVRYIPQTRQIWAVCGNSGFYVLELTPAARARLR
jgi:hypothetical protein